MYEYFIEKPSKEISKLYEIHFPKRYKDMMMYERRGVCTLYITCRSGDVLVGAMGIKKHQPKYYRYLHIVVHPDHRQKGIGNSIRYMAIKLLKEQKQAEIIDFWKEDNEFGHKRFKDIGFKLMHTINRYDEKHYQYVGKISKLKGLDEIWKSNITHD